MQTILRSAEISFPMFGDKHFNPPASFELFGHTFYLYGAIIALGFLLGILYCAHKSERFIGIPSDVLYDFILWLLPTAIIGARIYYVIFQWDQYKSDPLAIFRIWEGGLAIYGGIIAGLFLVIIWCRRRRIPFGALGDLSIFGLLIGQTLGRWGFGHGFYIVWPFIGPSSVRETFGRAGDYFLYPAFWASYAIHPWYVPTGIQTGFFFNDLDDVLPTYFDLKKAAVDPYIMMREAWVKHRAVQVAR